MKNFLSGAALTMFPDVRRGRPFSAAVRLPLGTARQPGGMGHCGATGLDPPPPPPWDSGGCTFSLRRRGGGRCPPCAPSGLLPEPRCFSAPPVPPPRREGPTGEGGNRQCCGGREKSSPGAGMLLPLSHPILPHRIRSDRTLSLRFSSPKSRATRAALDGRANK